MRTPAGAGRRLRLPAVLVAAVSVALLPGPASASRAKAKQTQPGSATSEAAPPAGGSAQQPVQAQQPAAAPAHDRGHGHGAGSGTGDGASPAGAEAPAAKGAPDRGRHHGNAGSSHEPGAQPAPGRGEGASGSAQHESSKAARERQRQLTNREQREQRRKGHEPASRSEAPPAARSAAPEASQTPAFAPVATAASATPPPSTASTPPAQTPPAARETTGAGAPTASRKVRGRHRAARRGTGRAGRAAPVVAVTPATAPGVGASGATSGDGARRHTPATPAHHAHASSSPIPIVTTVTKIIDVVPGFLRIVIAALVLVALALAVSSRVVALRARRLARQRRELLDDVGLLQAALLPSLPERLGPVGTTAAYRPASGPGAGGDFFDVFALSDGQVAVIVGDVSGHGRAALPHTTLVRYTLRAYLDAGLSPRGALQTAAPVLERQLGDSFATVALATYNPRSRTLVYASAGHPPPLIIGADGAVPTITAASAPPIGVGQTTGTRQTAVTVPGGALVCFYTDGVVEARRGGELYGAARLEETLVDLGVGASAERLLDRVAAESEERPDDMAACLLRVEGLALAPAVEREELEVDRGEALRDRAERFLLAGGLEPSETAAVLAEVRGAVARHGRVLLELELGEGAPAVHVRPQNIAVIQPPLRGAANVGTLSR